MIVVDIGLDNDLLPIKCHLINKLTFQSVTDPSWYRRKIR